MCSSRVNASRLSLLAGTARQISEAQIGQMAILAMLMDPQGHTTTARRQRAANDAM